MSWPSSYMSALALVLPLLFTWYQFILPYPFSLHVITCASSLELFLGNDGHSTSRYLQDGDGVGHSTSKCHQDEDGVGHSTSTSKCHQDGDGVGHSTSTSKCHQDGDGVGHSASASRCHLEGCGVGNSTSRCHLEGYGVGYSTSRYHQDGDGVGHSTSRSGAASLLALEMIDGGLMGPRCLRRGDDDVLLAGLHMRRRLRPRH